MRFLFNPITSQFNAAPPREIIYSDTAPAFPVEGTRWVNTLEIREYVFTFDANGSGYWVEVGIGSTGPQGETGEIGAVGPVGPQGIQGEQGPAATVAVGTVSTGEPGTSVAVSNAGTSTAAVLDFTIPRGAVGETGAVGPQGPQGIQGPRGDDGASVVLKGAVNFYSDLPSIGNTEGDLYVVQNDGNGYVWDGADWVNVGQIRGPKGDTGAQGPAGPAPAGTGAVVVSNGVVGTPVGYGTANVASTLVQRDANGNFSAGTITANLTGNVTGSVTGGVSGNAGTATKLATARTINVSGDVTGTAQSFDGSANITIPTAIAAGSIVNADISATAAIADTKLATISTAGKVLNSATTATSANTAFAIVSRDTNGNFSANQITANLTGNVTGNATNVSGTVAILNGGTGATTAAGALVNLGAAAATHTHDASAINSGTLANARLPARLQAAAQTITDWDNALENGWFQGNQAANAPENVLTWWLGYVEVHNPLWVTQTVHRFTADAPTNTQIWRRSSADSAGATGHSLQGTRTRVWGAWYKLQLSQTEQDARYSLGTHTHTAATTTVAGFMSSADKTKLDGVATGANAYVHPTGDGNLHVPATSTTNNGRVLKAGATAGSLSWGTLTAADVGAATSGHTHDDRYYTQIEMGTLLSGKANSVHTHSAATTTTAGFMSAADKTKLDGFSTSSGVPLGAVMAFAMNSVPTGWLAANGAAVSRATYATLFAAIGTTYGAGDASTTFNLPNLRGIFVRGSSVQILNGITYNGGSGGDVGGTQNDQFQSHYHSTRSESRSFVGPGVGWDNWLRNPGTGVGGANVAGPITGQGGTVRTGTETRPANINMLYCIKF
jgi:hypothetical protein